MSQPELVSKEGPASPSRVQQPDGEERLTIKKCGWPYCPPEREMRTGRLPQHCRGRETKQEGESQGDKASVLTRAEMENAASRPAGVLCSPVRVQEYKEMALSRDSASGDKLAGRGTGGGSVDTFPLSGWQNTFPTRGLGCQI